MTFPGVQDRLISLHTGFEAKVEIMEIGTSTRQSRVDGTFVRLRNGGFNETAGRESRSTEPGCRARDTGI